MPEGTFNPPPLLNRKTRRALKALKRRKKAKPNQ